MEKILVPVIALYLMLDFDMQATISTLKRLKTSKSVRIILAANNELSSYPELHKAVSRLLRYKPQTYTLALHPSLNDPYYLHALVNRSTHNKSIKTSHALIISTAKNACNVKGDSKRLTEIRSKLDLAVYLNEREERR
ncbi:hypothetical protein [Vibrio penaeicida]|uniref:Uncharacterized protein n=1 Tax=Vibrio penaeicida TaxID=104609 RepID=A0AAV5NKR1_9VIBR|nr:hypothetical protein [Vibrio penaeicida]RTZ24916.1 hypothetical protein EKN09_01200 [Vibrio penaeicida]GLQ71199.1 hypothetical protein GCM10007932_05590 [Vibrio penaeicida]